MDIQQIILETSKTNLHQGDIQIENIECPLCFEEKLKTDSYTTPCGHTFCINCIDTHYKTQRKGYEYHAGVIGDEELGEELEAVNGVARGKLEVPCPLCRASIGRSRDTVIHIKCRKVECIKNRIGRTRFCEDHQRPQSVEHRYNLRPRDI